MRDVYLSADSAATRHWSAGTLLGLLAIAYRGARLPLLLLLAVVEPIVRVVCAGLALLGVLATVLFKLTSSPNFPAWTMLAVSFGFAVLLLAYESLIRALSR
jgi:hypothetical protein